MIVILNWLRDLFKTDPKIKENILAFACGDIMLFTVLGVNPEMAVLGWKMISTVLLAAGGGFAGMLGKDLYLFILRKIKEWIKRRKNERLPDKKL